jgi:hypothetical protein
MRARRRRFTWEELADLDRLPVLARRHPSRFRVTDWTPEMRRQILASPQAPCLLEDCI